MTSRDYPSSPLLGVSGLVRNDGKVLLVRRGRPPLEGVWSFPGGLVHAGERLDEAVAREVREETAIEIDRIESAGFEEIIDRDEAGAVRHHFVLAVFEARYAQGDLTAGDDAAEARWADPASPGVKPLTAGTARRLNMEAGR